MEADGEAALCRLNGSIVRRGGGDGFTRDLRGCVKGGWGGGAVVGVDRIGRGNHWHSRSSSPCGRECAHGGEGL